MGERGRAAPVPLAGRVNVQMRRAPVLHQRRHRIPALAPVHALEIAVAGPAGLDEVALVHAFTQEAHQIAGLPALAEWATEAGCDPGAAAEMAGEPPASVLDEVPVAGHAAAPGADARGPDTVRQLARGREVLLEPGPEPREGEE